MSTLSDRLLDIRDNTPPRGRRATDRTYDEGYRVAMEEAARMARGVTIRNAEVFALAKVGEDGLVRRAQQVKEIHMLLDAYDAEYDAPSMFEMRQFIEAVRKVLGS